MNPSWWKRKEEIKNLLEWNYNENTTYENLWDTQKAVFWGNFYKVKCLH